MSLSSQLSEWLETGHKLLLQVQKAEGTERRSIRKTDEELQVVWAEVYTADQPDTHGDIMRPHEVQKLAWRFLANGLTGMVDVQHDNDTSYGAVVVESFFVGADEPHPLYLPNSWVCAVHIDNKELWERVKAGEINGFSMQANVFMQDAMHEFELPDDGIVNGKTLAFEGDEETPRHYHGLRVRFDLNGEFLGGQTLGTFGDVPDHGHVIEKESVTENSGDHNHRFSLIDALMETTSAGGSNA